MKKGILTLFFISTLFFVAKAQFTVEIRSNRGNDTVKTCSDSTITFYAVAYDGATQITSGLTFSWDFGDGENISQLDLDTISHTFVVTQLYRVIVTAEGGSYWDNDAIVVELGLAPWFIDSKTDIPDNQDGICKGEKVLLTGSANSHFWEEKIQEIRTEVFPQYIDNENSYSSYITRKDFDDNNNITAATDIDSIGINIEHSDASNLLITLTCPNGQSAILKNNGGVQKALGEPIITPGDYSEGLGWNYYWTNSPTYGTMNTYAGIKDTLPQGSYTPDNGFANFIGCPYNGNWTISVEDLDDDTNDGYVFSWSLIFNPINENIEVKYKNSYNINSSFWNGDNVNITSNGICDAFPYEYGNHPYKFYISDDWGCIHDTSINVVVEQANFDIDKRNLVIGDSTIVTDKTSWTLSRTWDFGDESDFAFEESEYKKYQDKGVYTITMTIKSASGCEDIDTAKITVIPKPISVDEYNIFTPNNDGINDVFSFFNTPEEKITAANIDEITGRIFNRYGQTICKWDTQEEILKGWDGTVNNNGIRKAPPGFYYYVLIIKGKDGIKYEPFSGFIYLYRQK